MRLSWPRADQLLARGRLGATEITVGPGALANALFVANIAHTQVLFALPSGGSGVMALAAGAIHVGLMGLHEVGHSLGRGLAGLRSTRIHVGLYCYEEGVAPQYPRQDLLHSLGGPAADSAAAVATGLAYLGARQLDLGPHVTFLTGFAAVRAGLALVELIPVFPLDGAQALRARLIEGGTDPIDATDQVAKVGVMAASAIALMGAAGLVAGGSNKLVLAIWALGVAAGVPVAYVLGKREVAFRVASAQRELASS